MEEQREKNSEEKKTGALQIIGKVVKFLFSSAGLFFINIAYILLGMVIFMKLEQPNEREQCFVGEANYKKVENASVYLMMDILTDVAMGRLQLEKDPDLPGYLKVREEYQTVLRAFTQSVLDIGHDVSVNCSRLGEEGTPYTWSEYASLVFAMTVTTTIGYGVVAPATTTGRYVCVAYAIIGIPIMMIFVVFVGGVLADIFRYVYAVICCCGCCIKGSKKKEVENATKQAVQMYPTDKDGKPLTDEVYPMYDGEEEDEDEDEDLEEENETITVPLTISILVMLVFTVFGATLFMVLEGYNFVDAVYFCFVTYSTIGFGDIVPGAADINNPMSAFKMILAGLYQVLGVAVLSMCFQLMQDELIAKLKWLGEKLGIGKKTDKTQAGEERTTPDESVKQK